MRWMVLVRQLSWFYLAWFVSIGSIVHITVGQCKFIFYVGEGAYRSLPPILYIFTPRPTALYHIGGAKLQRYTIATPPSDRAAWRIIGRPSQ